MKISNIFVLAVISLCTFTKVDGQNSNFKVAERLANNGDLETCTAIGQWYAKGNSEMGISIDYDKAMYWYKKAADQGYGKALNNLAYLYLDGKGTEKNVNKELTCWSKRIMQGMCFPLKTWH